MSENLDKEAQLKIRDSKNQSVYTNATTAEDLDAADELTVRLKNDILDYSKTHQQLEPTENEYSYSIGKFIYDEGHREGVTLSQRVDFAKMIESTTDPTQLIGRPLGKGVTDSRHPYLLTCQWIYLTMDKETASSLVWGDLSEIYARPRIRSDSRVAKWSALHRKGMTRTQFREVLKTLSYYSETHDISFFSDDILYEHMDKFYEFEKEWERCFALFFCSDDKQMSRARGKYPSKYKKKYLIKCLDKTKFLSSAEIAPICQSIFKEVYVDVWPK